ncbi:MAG: hypothetical protein WC307_03830 [Candidatus Nanoarchaeia archaeon]|jgi:hypothetical protein
MNYTHYQNLTNSDLSEQDFLLMNQIVKNAIKRPEQLELTLKGVDKVKLNNFLDEYCNSGVEFDAGLTAFSCGSIVSMALGFITPVAISLGIIASSFLYPVVKSVVGKRLTAYSSLSDRLKNT